MLEVLDILDEKNKFLRQISNDVIFPITNEEKKLIKRIKKQLKYSQIDDKAAQYSLRPGMGLAFPQLGILKRIIVIVHEYDEGLFEEYVVVNPKIISSSKEIIAAEAGEGCLSVNREVEGHVPRNARITLEGYDLNGNKINIRAREELSIAFQHEIDHLNGILFYDRINKDKLFYNENEIRLL